MILYGINTCDTCRKAKSALSAAGHDVSVRDVRKTPLDEAALQGFLSEFGEAIVNRSSATWRGLSEIERNENVLQLLQKHPTLMKRPVIEHQGKLYLGWKEDTRAALLK